MTQIMYAGDAGISSDEFISRKKSVAVFSYYEWMLALVIVLGGHAALVPFLQSSSVTPPHIVAPQALPMEIALTAPQPEVVEPPPVVVPEPEPVVEPEPPLVDDVAPEPAKPEVAPKPKAKPTPVKKTVAAKPQPATPQVSRTPPATAAAATTAAPVQTVTPPLANANYLHNPAPDYPESAIDRGQEGTVLLKVQVNTTGTATDVQIHKSSGVTALDDAALRTVRRWSFVPAKRGHEAISGQVIVPVDFSLNS